MTEEFKRKTKNIQRASYRFNKVPFENFRAICKDNGFNQTKVLEKLMEDFVKKMEQEKKNDK